MKLVAPDKVSAILKDVGQRVILPRWRNLAAGEVKEKTGPRDLVTVADVESEKEITQALLDLLPGSIVVGEEAYAADSSVLDGLMTHGGPVWIVDPIDGTWSFSNGKSWFGTIVALVQNNETVQGWIHHPVTGDDMVVEKGSGAWFKGQRLKVLPAATELLGLTGFRAEKWINQHPEALEGHIRILHKSRPACHDYIRLLTGTPMFNEPWPDEIQAHFRIILERSKPWDDAAGLLAIQEGGGCVRTLEGEEYKPSYMNIGVLATPNLASNDYLRPIFQKIRNDIDMTAQK